MGRAAGIARPGHPASESKPERPPRKSLDDGHAFTGFPKLFYFCPQWALRKPIQDLIDQGKDSAQARAREIQTRARWTSPLIQDRLPQSAGPSYGG